VGGNDTCLRLANEEIVMVRSGNDGRSTRRQFIGAAGGFGAAALTSLALEACGGTSSPQGASTVSGASAAHPKRGGTLNEARYEAIDGFKLDSITANTTYQACQAVMEPLVRVNPNGHAYLPGLAESWSTDPTGKVWTFTLAPNVRFSDGSPCTSKDVEFSVDTWKAGPNNGGYYTLIKDVQIIDNRTFKLHLSVPDFNLTSPLSMAIAGVIPANFHGMSATQFWQTPIGAGPFKLGSWSISGPINYTRNPYYFRPGLPYLDAIVNTLTTNGNQSRLAFLSGELDVVDGVFGNLSRGYPSGSILWEPVHFTDVLLFNTKAAPFDTLAARQAAAYAIDYEGIIPAVYKGKGTPPAGWLPPNVGIWATPSKPYFRQNLKLAQSLAKSSGLAGQTVTLRYPPEEENFDEVAAIVQANLKAIGVDVTLTPEATPTFLGNVTTGKYQLAIWGYNASAPDMGNNVQFITTTNTFFTGYPPSQLNAMLAAFYATPSTTKQHAIVQEMQNFGSANVPFVALDNSQYGTAISSHTHGVQPTPWGYYYYDTIWKS
jgi:peptide/nickel transport system substrate-binding protein